MTGAVCGGVVSWSKYIKKPLDYSMMITIRRRFNVKGKYRYAWTSPIQDHWVWCKEEKA